MGASAEEDLPKGERTIGLKWVYAYKTDTDGAIIVGKKKARLVAQGFNQWPGQYDETYAPVAKMASICILLTWAASHDLEIYQFNCKTAFLHAKVQHPIYAHPFPGYNSTILGKVLCVLLGECSKFLSILIIRDQPKHHMWLSLHVYISELLDKWNLSSCKIVSMPFPSKVTESVLSVPTNSLPDICDADLTTKYQRIVSCLLYLAVTTGLIFHTMLCGLASIILNPLMHISLQPNMSFVT